MGNGKARVVREATAADGPRIVELLAEAFAEDPVLRWLNPRADFPRTMFEGLLPFYMERGHAMISEDGHGAALWMPPGVEPAISDLGNFFSQYWKLFGTRAAIRMARFTMLTNKHHIKEPHYYLFTIGVAGAGRGTGIASSLLNNGLAMADRDGVPVYLENSNEKNRAIYAHFGFIESGNLDIRNGPTLWPMVRHPQAA